MAATSMFARPIPREAKRLLVAALLLFTITVVIGILNGTGAVTFGHDELMTHVHARTLGWITLAVFGTTIWLFAGEDTPAAGWISWLSIVSVALYIVAFWVGTRIGAVSIFLLFDVGLTAYLVSVVVGGKEPAAVPPAGPRPRYVRGRHD